MKRKPRYNTQALVFIAGFYDGEIVLKDISVTGCRIESTAVLDVTQGKVYRLRITPEKPAQIETFEIEAEARWVHVADFTCDVGFSISESPKKKFFDRYVDYLAYRENAA